MGAFFTNVQVHTGGRPAQQVHGEVIAALRARILRGPYVEVLAGGRNGEVAADRRVMVSQPGPEPWLAVFDEATEDQDIGALSDLACALSAAVGTAAVAVFVYDSEVLELRLCRGGAVVDAYSSMPEYFHEHLSHREREQLAGDEVLWRELLVSGATPAQLRAAWDDESADFAEDVLQAVGLLLGFHPELCALGFTSANEVGDPAQFTRLSFRRRR